MKANRLPQDAVCEVEGAGSGRGHGSVGGSDMVCVVLVRMDTSELVGSEEREFTRPGRGNDGMAGLWDVIWGQQLRLS